MKVDGPVVDEWARRHGGPFTLRLEGPAGTGSLTPIVPFRASPRPGTGLRMLAPC